MMAGTGMVGVATLDTTGFVALGGDETEPARHAVSHAGLRFDPATGVR